MAALITWTGHNLADAAALSVDTGVIDPDFPLTNARQRGLAAETASVPTPGAWLRIIADLSVISYAAVDSGFAGDANDTVRVIAVQPDGKVLIGGDFTSAGFKPRAGIARLNVDGTLDADFDADVTGTSVRAIVLQPDGKILIAGEFTAVGGVSRSRIARLNPDGSLDTSFSTPAPNNTINAMVLLPTGNIVVAGAFTSFGGITTRQRLALLSPTGGVLPGWSLNINNVVNTLALQPDGKVLLAGVFTLVGGSARNRIARLNADGTLDTGFNPNANGAVHALVVEPAGTILVGGAFNTIGGQFRGGFARISNSGATQLLDIGLIDTVYAIALQDDGRILVGGDIDGFYGMARRYRADGSADQSFQPIITAPVHAFALQPDGRILIGGEFSSPQRSVMRAYGSYPGHVRMIGLLGMTGDWSSTMVVYHRANPSAPEEVVGIANMAQTKARGDYLPAHLVAVLDTPLPVDGQIILQFIGSDVSTVRFGRLWIGDALVLPDGVDAGWSMSFRDSGSLDATDGQQWVESPGVITRVLTVPLEGARKTELHWGFADGATDITNQMSLNALQLEAGTTGEVIAIARTQSDLWVSRTMVYGHIDQPWAIGHTAGPYWGGTLTVVEER